MEYMELNTTDLQVSRICFGTLWIGGIEDEEAIRTIHRGIDLGINFFDTAEGYGKEYSEKVLGKALEGRRDKVVIATKGGLDWGQFSDQGIPQRGEQHYGMTGKKSEGMTRNSRPDYIKAAVEGSLKRLGTDYIDLYQIHWPDSTTPWADTIHALLECQREGKIRYIGVSNFSAQQVKEWIQFGPLHSVQSMYHMLTRDIEKDILPFCRKNNIAVLSYSTLAHGLLTGKFSEDTKFPLGDFRPKIPVFEGDNFKKNLVIVEKLKKVAARKEITPGQLAIGWVLAQPSITSALVGAKHPGQVVENVAAVNCKLDEDDLAEIEEILLERNQ